MGFRGYRWMVTVLVVAGVLWIGAAPAAAGGFADLYLGGAFHSEDNATFSGAGQRVSVDTDPDNAWTVGYRMGYWFEGVRWLGVALDGSYYTHDSDFADVTIFPISALLMVQAAPSESRYPAATPWVPYAGIGPALFIADIEFDVDDAPVPGLVGIGGLSGHYEDDITEIGLDVRAGIRYMFRENMGIFGEYRYTSFSPEFEEDVMGTTVETSFDADTHHVVFGLNYGF